MQQDAKKIIKIILLSFLFVFILSYGFYRSKELIFGIRIKDVKINKLKAEEQSLINTNTIELTGIAKNAILLNLNGREISIDQQGNFYETIPMSLGYNKINIRAEDKFGNNDEKNYQLIYRAKIPAQ